LRPSAIANVQMTVAMGDDMPALRECWAFMMAIYPRLHMVVFGEFPTYPKTDVNIEHHNKLGPLPKQVRGSMIGINPKAD
jgi:hypothetical protein